MVSNLNTYPNLQYNPISIPDFTVVEIYKDTVAKANSLGYCILPIEGLDNQTIEENIITKVRESAPETYSNLAILNEGFNRKVVYAVWYKGDAPVYPSNEIQPALIATEPFNVWEEVEINNPSAPAAISLELDCSSLDLIEFYINDNLFSIKIENPSEVSNIVLVDGTGVKYNNKNIATFDFPTMPKIKNGLNCLKFNKTMIKGVKIKYIPKY